MPAALNFPFSSYIYDKLVDKRSNAEYRPGTEGSYLCVDGCAGVQYFYMISVTLRSILSISVVLIRPLGDLLRFCRGFCCEEKSREMLGCVITVSKVEFPLFLVPFLVFCWLGSWNGSNSCLISRNWIWRKLAIGAFLLISLCGSP